MPHAPLAAMGDAAIVGGAADGEQDTGGEWGPDGVAEAGAGRLASDLGFELLPEFQATFTTTAGHLAAVLTGPPSGEAYTAAISALKKLTEILDRIFLAFGCVEELGRVSGLREASEAFRRDFGAPRLAEAMCGLLRDAGFERREASGNAGAVWIFPHEDALARLRALTVRLVLQKSAELQKARGPGRFLHRDNDAVVPRLEDAAFVELVDLYRGRSSSSTSAPGGAEAPRPSLRERNFEAEVRIKLNQRRAECGFEALSLHEGLAGIARTLAEAQRTRARKDADDIYPTRKIAGEVRAALARVPLPPGFSVAHLHWSSTELPRLFGLASTRGGNIGKDGGAASAKDAGDADAAAEILGNEAVGFWAVRQQADVYWPAATICGVGAALDYTVNKGFVVALVVGFETQRSEDAGLPSSSSSELRRRPSAVGGGGAASAAAAKRPGEPVKFTPAGSFKPRITGFRDLHTPKPPGGG